MAGNKYQFDNIAMLVKTETNPGAFIAPDTIVPFERGSGSPEPKFDTEEIDPYSGFLGSKKTILTSEFAEIDYSAKMRLPSNHLLIAPLLSMCGLVATDIDGGKSYIFSSTSKTTSSIRWIEERTTTEAVGGVSDLELTAEVGKSVEVNFSTKSTLHQVVDLASTDENNTIPSAPAIDAVFMTSSCTAYLMNGETAHFDKISFKLGADAVIPKTVCPIGGYISEIKPELTVSMSLTEENEGAFNDLKSGTEFNFVIPFFDINGVKKWELITPKCVVISQKKSEKSRMLSVERTLECRKSSGDDNFEIKGFD